jgi:hypothetical protein
VKRPILKQVPLTAMKIHFPGKCSRLLGDVFVGMKCIYIVLFFQRATAVEWIKG